MASRLAQALAEYTRRPRLGDKYRSEHHGDWIVYRIDSDGEIVLHNPGHGFITKSGAGLLKLRRL